MRTARQTNIRRAVLSALDAVPGGYLLPDDMLRADAARLVTPRPTTAELDAELAAADAARLILGVPGEEATKWKLTDAGRAWLAEHP
jgi:hypothetical protein